MELWVRSQLKELLIKVNDLRVMQLTEDGFEIGKKTDDWFIVANDGPCVGKYKSKERALEVLDEIQNILIIKNSFNLSEEIINKCFKNSTEEEIQKIVKTLAVYEMPEE